jgi:hypothetical protein
VTDQRAVQARAWTVQAQASATERCGETLELRVLVKSLEGVCSLRSFNACSDKKSLSCSFEPERKSSAVRMLARCAHPTATFVAAPTNTHTSFTSFAGTQNDAPSIPAKGSAS